MQRGFHRILRCAGRLKASIDRIRDQLVENLQLDLHNYIRAAFAAKMTRTRTHRGRTDGSVHVAFRTTTDS